MKPECIAAVAAAAKSLNLKVDADKIKGIEKEIEKARTLLARENREAYNKMSKSEQLEKAAEKVAAQVQHNAMKKRQRYIRDLTVERDRAAAINRMMDTGLTHMEALDRYTFFKADGSGGVQSIESLATARAAKAIGELQALHELEHASALSGIIGNKQGMLDFVKESYGQDSKNPLAKKAWEEVSSVRDRLIKEFNDKGGDIGRLENYRNPQRLDPYSVMKAGKEEFVKKMMNLVDRNEYVNEDGTLFDNDQMVKFLEQAYRTVATDGGNKAPGEHGGGGRIADRQRAHRQLHYKSPEAYIQAMEEFGAGNPFDQTISSIQQLTRNIELVDKFGSNAILNFDKEYARAINEGDSDSMFGSLRSTFERFSGQREIGDVRVAYWFQQARAAIAASRLGSMVLSQLADKSTFTATARAMNIPFSEVMNWTSNIASDSELRSTLRYHGIGLDSLTNNVARWADDTSKAGFFGKAASTVMTIQGAHVWTRWGRQAFGAMMEAKMGDLVGKYKSLADLGEHDKKIMESKGVSEEDWKLWQLAKPYEYKGSKLLNVRAINEVPLSEIINIVGPNVDAAQFRDDSGLKLLSMSLEETHMAVLQPSERNKIDTKKGFWLSELGSFMLQFKTFPWAVFRQHFIDRANFTGNPWIYRARLAASSAVMGGIALMLGDLAAGKTPRDIIGDEDDSDRLEKFAKFGTAAFLKGGGLGIASDMVESFVKVGNDPREVGNLLGPGPGYVSKAIAPTVTSGVKSVFTQDEKDIEKFTKGLYDSITGIAPGQNLWFLRGMLHNVILQDLHEMASPGYSDRIKEYNREQFGNEYWLGMGNGE